MSGTEDRVSRIQDDWRRERPDLDPSPQGVIGRIHRVGMELTRELTAVYARFGLTEAEFDLLASLRRAGAPYSRPAGELAEHTMVTSGGLTKRVDRLAQRGLVTRSESDADGRRRLVALTDAGRSLIDDAFTAHIANEHRLVAMLEAPDAEHLARILQHWGERLDADG